MKTNKQTKLKDQNYSQFMSKLSEFFYTHDRNFNRRFGNTAVWVWGSCGGPRGGGGARFGCHHPLYGSSVLRVVVICLSSLLLLCSCRSSKVVTKGTTIEDAYRRVGIFRTDSLFWYRSSASLSTCDINIEYYSDPDSTGAQYIAKKVRVTSSSRDTTHVTSQQVSNSQQVENEHTETITRTEITKTTKSVSLLAHMARFKWVIMAISAACIAYFVAKVVGLDRFIKFLSGILGTLKALFGTLKTLLEALKKLLIRLFNAFFSRLR